MYVSLEPCAHYGKTPPCASRLVKEQVKEVIVCNVDPFEKVGGKGMKILQDAGIKTTTGVMNAEGLWLNRRFYCFHQQKRPYIILKWAQTHKGFIAPLNRTRYQISNESSKQLVHKWRIEEDAIMVGYNTALHDDPQLTARLWKGKQPLRIVLDKQLQLPSTLRLFDGEADTWVVNEQREELRGSISYKKLSFDNLLPGLMAELHSAAKLSVIVEGGAHLLNSFIAAGLWDEARVFIADKDLEEGIAAPLLNTADMAQQQELGADTLQLFVNGRSAYRFVNGMDF
jgi:diaminohydroxyphosphoribosylaminopyrimidine deaminase/5-amino-6-(5-phosphoribosylamino)uracil reductase